jgi:hypothetical protein
MPDTNSDCILDTIRVSFGRVVYTHKTYEKQLEILNNGLNLYRWIRFVVIAITATGTIGVLLTNQRVVEIATAVFGTISLLLTLYGMGFGPEKLIYDHRRTARRLWLVRERYLHLISDLVSERITDDEAAKVRDSLTRELAEIYQDAPDTSSKAYQKARMALKIFEEMTFTDKEIDEFLPQSLRKDKSETSTI